MDSKKCSCDDKHPRPQFAAQLLEIPHNEVASSKQILSMDAMDFDSAKLFSVTYPEFYLAKKNGTRQTCKQTVKHSSYIQIQEFCYHVNTFLDL